ncbi:MAG: hypothetical protein LBB59_05570 [Campylobacteraceae bacterium]|jgi:hypothetical protein|nr:hypothetical protein [Campylobacteraceae bacterium]
MSIGKNVISIAFAIFIITVFTGCAPKYINVNKSLSEGKSVIVVPTYYSQNLRMYWGKDGGRKLYNHENINSYYHNLYNSGEEDKYFKYDFPIDADYQVLAVDPGVYYISEAYVSVPEWKYTLELPVSSADTQKFKSNIGNIWIKKTPERERDNSGKRQEVTSYYKMEYTFAKKKNVNNSKSAGTITIYPNEIVLAPAVWTDVEIAHNSCKFEDEQWFLFGILDIIATPSTIFYSNDEDTWYWSCPIKSIALNIKTKSINDFLDKVTPSPFSIKDFENITIRDFELGEMFKNATLKTLDDGTKQYIIYGNSDEQEKSD